ncbi:hypothetical protein FZC66_08205 [Priestia megaterium]|nr:hypothetical protein FZC66_08205 [Priestia megaterium]
MNLATIIVLSLFGLGLIVSLFFLKKQNHSHTVDDLKPIISVNGHVKFAEGIDQIAISKIEMFDQHLIINQVAIIPFERVHRADFAKLIKNEKGVHGGPVQRYFGELKIHFIDKNGQDTYICCVTPKKNQFHLIYQYDLMKKQLNKHLGIEDDHPHLTLQEPYEL